MSTLLKTLESIEAAALGNDRLDAIKRSNSAELRRLFVWVLDKDITFGVKAMPDPTPSQTVMLSDEDWFVSLEKELLHPLADRELTGNAAKKRISSFLGVCSSTAQKWTERVLKQDLRLSVGAKDVNKVIPGTVNIFSLPLAVQQKELKSYEGRWKRQPKMDGGRVVTRLGTDGSVVLISRSGKEWVGFKPIKDALHKLTNTLSISEPMTIDGEVVIYDKHGRMDFQAIQKLFHAPDRPVPADKRLVYVIFDYCSTKEYDAPKTQYEVRFKQCADMFNAHIKGTSLASAINLIDSVDVVDPREEDLEAVARDHVERLGCDGAIIRRANAVPRNKKSVDIVKIKPFDDAEAVVVGRVEGEGKLVGSLGKLTCRILKKGKPTGPEFGLGTGEGLTDALRQELWDDKDLIGKIVNFKYQRISEDDIPILPTFRAIRHKDDM